MQSHDTVLLLSLLTLAACGAPPRPPPPDFVIPPGPPAQSKALPAPETLPPSAFPNSNPEVQQFLSSHPEYVGRGPAPVPRPSASTAPFYAAPPNVGPITGYGPGGMAAPPGAPPNPPYPAGGLTGPR